MTTYLFKIYVTTKNGRHYEIDVAETEADARQQATGWTSQRGQMTWTARIVKDGVDIATYKRGVEVKP